MARSIGSGMPGIREIRTIRNESLAVLQPSLKAADNCLAAPRLGFTLARGSYATVLVHELVDSSAAPRAD